jgi:hypothetical protein
MNGAAGNPVPALEDLTNVVRRERTVRLLARAQEAITRWLKLREARDVDANSQYVGRHESQRDALQRLLLMTAEDLLEKAKNLSANAPPGDHFDECRLLDEAAIWLQRVWEFYSLKFDQRDDPVMGAVVRGADEVVWSCYHGVMMRARRNKKHRPQPLPFLASEYSPAALESDKPVPPSLRMPFDRPSWTAGLHDATGSLPITLLRLPPWCIEDPWWLVFVAHEVGHHVQADLGLVEMFSSAVVQATTHAGVVPGAAEKWGQWGREIFADVFSIMMIGSGAVRAIAEVERSTDTKMGRSTKAYPPPLVRLYLMKRVASLLGIAVTEIPDVVDRATLGADADAADAVVGVALGPLPGTDSTLRELCDFDAAQFGPAGPVASWADKLLTGEEYSGVPSHDTARLVVAGSLTAWWDVATIAKKEEREAARRALSRMTLTTLARSAPPGTRAKFVETTLPESAAAANLVDALLDAARQYGSGQGAET